MHEFDEPRLATASDSSQFYRKPRNMNMQWFKRKLKIMRNRIAVRSPAYVDLEREFRDARAQIAALRKENFELAARTGEISEKLCRVRVEANKPKTRFRLVTELDAAMIHEALTHGGGANFIAYLGRSIGHRAAYEIKQINFARWEDA